MERVEYSDRIEYTLNGRLHRENEPAIEYQDGSRYWYRNGKLHREDGPAVEYDDGTKEWYINGIQIPSQSASSVVRKTDRECLIYHEVPGSGQKYRLCSFSEEHLFTLQGLSNFQQNTCMYCKHRLLDDIYVQE